MMYKKLLITVFIFVTTLSNTTLFAQTVTSSRTSIDFGSVDTGIGGKQELFTVTGSNPDDPSEPITFTDITFVGTNASEFGHSNNCCDGGFTNVIHGEPGFEFNVAFSPTTPGNKSATMQLHHDGLNSPLEITLIGSSMVPLEAKLVFIESSPLLIGTANLGETITKDITIKNEGNIPLEISSYSFFHSAGTETDEGQFQLASTITLPLVIPVLETETLTVSFTPTSPASSGSNKVRASLTFVSNNSSGNSSIVFDGIENEPTPTHISSLNFSGIGKGTSKILDVNISNTADGFLDGNLVISGVNFTGTNASLFSTSTTFPITITPGNNANISLQFAPDSYGDKNATLQIQSNRPTSLSLIGKGLDKEISITETSLDFENLRKGSSLTKAINVNAIKGLNVNISNIEITGTNASDFTLIGNTTRTVVTGSTTQIEVKHSATSTGAKTANLVITSESINSPHTIALSSNIINSNLQVSTSTLNLDETIITNTSANKSVTLSNATGTDAVTVSNITISGTDNADFNLVGVTLPITIAAGSNTSFNVNFAPTIAGNKTAQIDVVSNDDNSPQIVSLTGKALAPKLNLSTTLLTFLDTEVVEQTRRQPFNIVNLGTSDLTINNITITGTNASEFQLEDGISFPITVSSLNSKTLNVIFSPTSVGMKGAKITVESSLAGNIELPMMGIGIAPKLAFSGYADFGNVNVKATKTNTVVLNNTGTNTLTVTGINVQGADATVFAVGALTFPLEIEIEKGGSIELPITLNPDTGGVKNANLVVVSNDLNSPNTLPLTANITTLPIFSAQTTPFKLNDIPDGENRSYTKYPITNTGASDLILYGNKGVKILQIDGAGIVVQQRHQITGNVSEADKNLNAFPITIPPGETKNILISFFGVADNTVKSYARLGMETNITSSGRELILGAFLSPVWINEMQFTAGRDVPGFSLATTDAIEFPGTSIGRSSETTFDVTNTGNTDLSIFTSSIDNLGMFRIIGEDGSHLGENHFSVLVAPGETRTFNVRFRPTGAEDRKTEDLILRTNIVNPGVGTRKTFLIPVTGLAVEPEDVEVNGLIFQADSKVVNGDFVTLKGNVHIGNLEFSNDVVVNLLTNAVQCDDCQMFATNIPEVGGFGGERVLLQSGNITTEVVITEAGLPELDFTNLVSSVSNRLFKLAFIPLEITKVKFLADTDADEDILSDGIEIGGTVTLPPEVFGEDSKIELETIRISTITGVDIVGNIEINPELNVLGIFTLNSAAVNFDTIEDSFGGSAEIGFELMGKGITVGAGLQIIRGGLDSVSLEIEVSPGIPIASTGFQLSGGNGFVKGLVDPPISIGLGVDISPVAPLDEVIYFDNMQLSYTFGTSFNAEGTIKLFGEPIGGGGVSVYANRLQQGVALNVWADVYDIFKGEVNLLAENRIDGFGNNNFNFEMDAKLSVQIPKIPKEVPCFPCGAINKFLPIVIAEAEVSMNTESMKADVTISEVLEFNVEVKTNAAGTGTEAKFGGNFFSIPFSFGRAAQKRGITNLVFENDEKAKALDRVEGQSLIIKPENAYKSKSSSKSGFTDVPFTLSQSYSNIIIRATGTTAIPNFTLVLPDGTELTPSNTASNGALYTTYDEINGAYYILKNTAIGDHIIRLEDSSDTYELDVAGAEFAPSISNITAVQNTTTNDITIAWNDQDFDSDAKVSFYYDIDDNGGNGFIIENNISENDATDQITWNADYLQNGTYYIYGKIDDGTHTPKVVYSSDTFTINKESMVAVPTLVSETYKDAIILSWSAVEDVHHYRVYIDEKEVTLYSFNQNVGKNTSFDFTEISPGRTYNFAVTAVLSDGTELMESNLSNIEAITFMSAISNNIPKLETETLPAKLTSCDEYVTTIAVSDPDATDVLSLTMVEFPKGMTLTGKTLNWFPTKDQKGKHEVILEVNDGNGGTDKKSYTVTIFEVDDVAPEITTCLTDVSVDADANNEFKIIDYISSLTVSDNCSSDSNITITQDVAVGSTVGIGDTVITFTATDENKNESTCSFTITVNSILGIDDVNLEKSIVLYPNPATHLLTIKSDAILINEVIIYDVLGKVLLTTHTPEIDISSLATGSYFARIIGDNGRSVVKKFIKK